MPKTSIMKATFIALMGSISFAAHAVANAQRIEIPAGELVVALESLSKQAEVDLVYSEAQVRGLRTAGVSGDLSPREAIEKLLEGTSLEVRTDEASGALLIAMPVASPRVKLDEADPGASTDTSTRNGEPAEGSRALSFSDRLRVAQLDRAAAGSEDGAASESGGDQPGEIVVTAQKREERLQDVPVPVTVLNADSLVDNNLLQLRDYYSKIPGLSYTPSGVGSPLIVIRGLTTGGASTTVGMVLDDVSYGASTYYSGAYSSYDIDPSELARVEVLRGPQGTLYGASSIGGLVKYVTVDPSTERLTGRVQAGSSTISGGHEPGYYVRGSLNLPLGETFALRASGFTRRDPGFIDNVGTGQRDRNRTDAEGGRLAALWRPSEDLSLKLSALQQRTRQPGSAQVDLEPGLGDLQNTNIRGTGGIDHDVEAYSANLTARIGSVDLTAVSGYNSDEFTSPIDLSFPFFNEVSQQYFGVYGTGLDLLHRSRKFTQELRLASSIGPRVDWVLGGFHTHEKGGEFNGIYGADPDTGANAGYWNHVASSSAYEEYALFSNFTFHVTERFDVQVGGRASRVETTAGQIINGEVFSAVFGTPDPSIIPQRRSKDNAFTYLVTPQLKLSPDLMVYARLASGYRPSGTNIGLPGTPLKYGSDSTQNYEIGAKGDILDHRLSFDASLYYIDWKDLQLSLNDGFSTFFANGGRAKSQGVELSTSWRPVGGLTLSGWVVWNDATLTEALPAQSESYGASGDRLPYSSRFSGTFSADQEFPLTPRLSGFLGGSVSYVGEREDNFPTNNFDTGLPSGPRLSFPAYTRVDLQAGVRSGAWSGSLSVNNVTDERGIVSGGYDPANTYVNFIQPRTIGLSFSRSF